MRKFPFTQQLNKSARSLMGTVGAGIDTVMDAVGALRVFKRPVVADILLLLLPLLALFLWSISLQTVTLNDMNDLGLILAFSPRIITVLAILLVGLLVTFLR